MIAMRAPVLGPCPCTACRRQVVLVRTGRTPTRVRRVSMSVFGAVESTTTFGSGDRFAWVNEDGTRHVCGRSD